MPKHRGTVFAVVRLPPPVPASRFEIDPPRPVLIGVYETLQRAEEIVGRSEQQFKDAEIEGFNFEIQTTVYYSE